MVTSSVAVAPLVEIGRTVTSLVALAACATPVTWLYSSILIANLWADLLGSRIPTIHRQIQQ